jgi:hypothetical protein
MFFDIGKISQTKDFALKFLDSLPLKQLEKAQEIVSEILNHIDEKITEKKSHGNKKI